VVSKGTEGTLLSLVCQQLGLRQIIHILEDILRTCVWEAGSCSSSLALLGCNVLCPSRNVLAGATRTEVLLQPLGGGGTSSAIPMSARQGFKMGLGSTEEMDTRYVFRSYSPSTIFMAL